MSGNSDRYIVIFQDVVIAVPEYAKPIVAAWCQKVNTLAWKERGKKSTKKKWKFLDKVKSINDKISWNLKKSMNLFVGK